jgi:hypothetical protein
VRIPGEGSGCVIVCDSSSSSDTHAWVRTYANQSTPCVLWDFSSIMVVVLDESPKHHHARLDFDGTVVCRPQTLYGVRRHFPHRRLTHQCLLPHGKKGWRGGWWASRGIWDLGCRHHESRISRMAGRVGGPSAPSSG